MINKLGLSSYAYYWALSRNPPAQSPVMSVEDLIERTADLGLGVIQICDNTPLAFTTPEELVRLRQLAERRNVDLEVGMRGLDILEIKQHIELCDELGARLLRVVPWTGSASQEHLPTSKLLEVSEKILPFCIEKDITIGFENYFDIPDGDLVQVIKEVKDPHIGICLDTANSTGFLQKPNETVELLAPYSVSVHMKDFIITKLTTTGYRISGVPLGKGWLEPRPVLEQICKSDRQPNILIELWVDPEESNQATLLKEEEWVKQSIEYLKICLSDL